jgi:two-component system LytT family response regulator
MKKLSTVIVDDEPLALKLLRKKLELCDQVEIVAECKNGREAINTIISKTPDLVFMDIQMPGLDGLTVAKQLQSDILPLIVFTTAYEQYALDAFDVHAVDYVLKPIDTERIQRAVHRALERFENGEEDNQNKSRIIGAIDAINEKEASNKGNTANKQNTEVNQANEQIERKIVIKDRDDITLLEQSQIDWVDAAGDYVCIHANGITHIKRSTLTKLLKELDPVIFKRVHRSTIVNLNSIKKVIPHTKGEFFLKLGEFDQVKVSRNYRETIKIFLTGM